MLSEERLAELAKRGLFVGPNESEANFLERVAGAVQGVECDLTEPYGLKIDSLILDPEASISLLHGAHTLIEGNEVKIAIKKTPLVSYEEALRHEAVHVVRSQYDEPLFEEFFAYATSSRLYRRLLGPLLTGKVLLGFILVLLAGFLNFTLYIMALSIFFIALITKYMRFKWALCRLKKIVPQVDLLPFALHLTDQELTAFSARHLQDPSLRWRQIRARFSLTSP